MRPSLASAISTSGAWLLVSACGSSGGPSRDAAPVPALSLPAETAASPAPAPAPVPAEPDEPGLASWRFLREKYDGDGDRHISRAEYARSDASFARLDADKDGVVSAADFDEQFDGVPRIEGKFQYGIGGPEVGDPAPEFTLPTTSGEPVSLAALRAKGPVALVFGSFT